MELFRDEVAQRKGINWGKVAFQRSLARQQQRQLQPQAGLQKLPEAVTDALVTQPAGMHVVDLSDALTQLSDDEAAVLFAQYKGCRTLSIANWATPSAKALRSLTLTIGPTLQFVDLSGSQISDEHFDTLVACANRLKSITADRCPHIGVNDNGVIAIASRLKSLRFLNLSKCGAVTDQGVIALGEGCPQLQVVNLEWLALLTDASIIRLAKGCVHMVSLNIGQCSRLTDKAVVAVAKHCSKVQALSVAGVPAITERAFGALVRQCKGLLMLNATGCIELSGSGLRAMVQGLQFVELASTFYGFKPVEEATAKKLQVQLEIIHDKSAATIQRSVKSYYGNKQARQRLRQQRLDHAASIITRAMMRYTKKLKAWRKMIKNKSSSSAAELQRVWRGFLGRRKADRRRVELDEFRAKTKFATQIQSMFRSHFEQRRHPEVAAAVEQLRVHRRREAEAAVAVRLQSVSRAHLARIRARIAGHYFGMLQKDRWHAIVTMQSVSRMFLCKLQMRQMQLEKQRIFELRSKAATRIQQFIRASYGRYSASLQAAELRLMKRVRVRAAVNIQRYYRGYIARVELFRLKAQKRLRIRAATVIQKIFRGSRILRWQALRMNRAVAHILDRSVTEFTLRARDCRTRELPVPVDSDSSDDEFAVYTHRKRFLDGTDPYLAWGGANHLVGKSVRVYWPVEERWFDGIVTAWDPKKGKHKVQYSDEDREWIALDQNLHRVQIWNLVDQQHGEGIWVLLDNYHPPESQEWVDEKRQEREQEQNRIAAWEAANQWQPLDPPSQLSARHNRLTARLSARKYKRKMLWTSEITGEIRTGSDDCHFWTVVADEYGWPTFVHSETGELSAFDPRFEDDQIDFKFQVLQEMRQVAYLCRDLLDRHGAAKPTQLRNVLREIRQSHLRKRLQMLAIQARDANQQNAAIDAPTPPDVVEEIDAAIRLSMALTDLADQFTAEEVEVQQIKATLIVTHPDKMESYLVCPHCEAETKKEFYFCQNCGKQQVEFEKRTRPKQKVAS